jgi:hypothetical protein
MAFANISATERILTFPDFWGYGMLSVKIISVKGD